MIISVPLSINDLARSKSSLFVPIAAPTTKFFFYFFLPQKIDL